MAISQEITRLQNAKTSLKSSINAKTDQQHQITTETIDDYSDFVDSIASARNWGQIGYSGEPSFITIGFNYAKQIYDNYVSTTTWYKQFEGDTNLIFVPLIDTQNVESFRSAFNQCNNLLYVPALKTGNSTEFRYMFNECFNLKYIDFTNFDIGKAENMRNMFSKCYSLIELDLSNFENDLSLTTTTQMFKDCINLKKLDIRKMILSAITTSNEMFTNIPYDCLIIVKNDTEKTWITSKFSRLTNVKTVAEYEAM